MQTTTQQLPTSVARMFAADERIVRVVEYADGWVPRAYRWPASGTGVAYTRREDGTAIVEPVTYDRKRSHGRGPRLVGFSARGGRLASR